jgi:membrane protease YdiL (CAAX protease family)
MNSLWSNLYDRFKDRRYGALFLACLLAFFGLLILAAIMGMVVNEFELQEYILQALLVVGLLAVAWGFLAFRGARQRWRERHKYSPLSRDELRVARSKLLKDRNEERNEEL